MKRVYQAWQPRFARDQDLIEQADAICDSYAGRGFSLTLRQLYYQLVTRNAIVNTDESYKRLGDLISKARRAGMIDWNHLVDRGRSLDTRGHWNSPTEIIASAAGGYAIDTWSTQPRRVEVWVEKDALSDVIQRPAWRWDINTFACKGYTSDSAIWAAGQRVARYGRNGQALTVLHLGDHDPSGLDMTRDIEQRVRMFSDGWDEDFEVRRIALNRDQIDEYDPPPNPAKVTDSRANAYIAEHGEYSWELDALDPDVLDALIDTEVAGIVDMDLLVGRRATEEQHRAQLAEVRERWTEITEWLEERG